MACERCCLKYEKPVSQLYTAHPPLRSPRLPSHPQLPFSPRRVPPFPFWKPNSFQLGNCSCTSRGSAGPEVQEARPSARRRRRRPPRASGRAGGRQAEEEEEQRRRAGGRGGGRRAGIYKVKPHCQTCSGDCSSCCRGAAARGLLRLLAPSRTPRSTTRTETDTSAPRRLPLTRAPQPSPRAAR